METPRETLLEKKNLRSSKPLCNNCSNFLNLPNVTELSRSRIRRDSLQVQIEKGKLTVVPFSLLFVFHKLLDHALHLIKPALDAESLSPFENMCSLR